MSRPLLLATFALLSIASLSWAQNPPALKSGSPGAVSAINRAMNEASLAESRHPKLCVGADRKPVAFKVGVFGQIMSGDSFFYELKRVLGEKEMIVTAVIVHERMKLPVWEDFIVRGHPTKGLARGAKVPLAGHYLITEISFPPGSGAVGLFVAEQESETARIQREAKEAAQARAAEEATAKTAQDRAIKAKVEAERKAEAVAAAKVSLARQFLDLGKKDVTKTKLQEVLRDHPKTKAAEEARDLLKKL